MKNLVLYRGPSTEDGTTGALWDSALLGSDDGLICFTLEEGWRGNKSNISCIPAGEYVMKKRQTQHHGITWEITGVPDRNGVLFHPGNTEADTKGCVLPALRFGKMAAVDDQSNKVEMQLAGLDSKKAWRKLMDYLGSDDTAMLEVVDHVPMAG